MIKIQSSGPGKLYSKFIHSRNWAFDTIFSARLTKPEANNIAGWLLNVSSVDFLKEHGTDEVPDRTQLAAQINRFTIILQAELSAADSYYVTEKRNWDTKGLIFSAEKDMDEPFRNILPEECISDIRDAGKCIAFELPTAVGFHICRAVETVLFLYFGVLNISLKGLKNPGMHAYIDLIEKEGVDSQIIEELRKLKKLRNALMHPDLALEAGDAQDLFKDAMKIIATMTKDMVRRQPLLATSPEEMESSARATKMEKAESEKAS